MVVGAEVGGSMVSADVAPQQTRTYNIQVVGVHSKIKQPSTGGGSQD